MVKKLFVVVSMAVLTVGGSTACATKKFVRTSVGDVNNKVDSLGRSVEQTEERTRRNEGRIGEVDQKAQAAAQAAQAANTAAEGARAAADSVGTEATAKFDSIDKASKRLVYEVVLSEDSGNYTFGKTTLSAEAKEQLDALISRLKQDPKNVYIEIEGHTDNVGPKDINDRIGLERAETVKRYFYEQYQVPLHKMSVISFGMEKPVAPNTTNAGRAQNRRVVIRVLA
jgi:outer membrane protein OmpA-like peptidoglycan-associated protein